MLKFDAGGNEPTFSPSISAAAPSSPFPDNLVWLAAAPPNGYLVPTGSCWLNCPAPLHAPPPFLTAQRRTRHGHTFITEPILLSTVASLWTHAEFNSVVCMFYLLRRGCTTNIFTFASDICFSPPPWSWSWFLLGHFFLSRNPSLLSQNFPLHQIRASLGGRRTGAR